jgi:uncharacterized protein YjbI with pentapeptide repeats
MIEIMSNCLTRGKVAKSILLVLVLFILILTFLPQNVLAEENRQVNASEILGKITRGEPVEVTNCVIIGDLDVSDLRKDLEIIEIGGIKRRIVESPIKIKDSTIQGNVNFNPIYFNDMVVFNNVTFEGRASFFYAVFNKQPDFQESTFKDAADFSHATFNKGAFFERAKFKSASFNNASFNKSAFFGFTTFDGGTTFRNAIFVKKADFLNSMFNNFTYFFNTTFDNYADFQWATFNDVVSFKHATFKGYATFMDATFNKKAYFDFAEFNNIADFYYTEFSDDAHFSNAIFNDTVKFNLAKFKERSFFLKTSFNKSVNFTKTYILLMDIEWKQLEGKLVYDDYFYQSLIRNFGNLGRSKDANDAYYEYRRIKQSQKEWGDYTKYIDAFSKCICGYGVRPLRAIRGAIFIIGLFSGLYWLIEVEGRCKRLWECLKDRGEGLWRFVFLGKWKNGENKKSLSDSSLKDSILKFVFLSVSIFTTLGKWNKWEPAKNHETKFRILAIIEVFLGWLIMVLFIISLTMTWIR